MWHIAAREWRVLFLSPLAWSVLAVVQFILAYIFFSRTEYFMQVQGQLASLPEAPGFTQIISGSTLGTAGIVLLLVVPLLTMRLISEERRNRTLSLLFSAPVSMTGIVLGKYLGLMGFLLLQLGLLSLMVLSLLVGGALDVWQFASGMLGLVLLTGSFVAIGLYLSTLSSHPTVAAISTFGVLLVLWLLNLTASIQGEENLLSYLSLTSHYESFLQGVFSTADLAYYLILTGTFLLLAIKRLDAERYR